MKDYYVYVYVRIFAWALILYARPNPGHEDTPDPFLKVQQQKQRIDFLIGIIKKMHIKMFRLFGFDVSIPFCNKSYCLFK